MDVRLPDGTVVNGVPDDISKADLAGKLSRAGYQVPQDWVGGQAPAQNPTLSQRAVGAGEATLAAISAPFAYLNGLAGGGNVFVKRLLAEAAGLPDASKYDPGQAYEQASQAVQYVPRTEQGREQTSAVMDALQGLAPVAGLTGETAALSQAMRAGRAGATIPTTARATAEGVARDAGALISPAAGDAAAAAVANAPEAVKRLPAVVKGAYDSTVSRINNAFGMSDAAPTVEGGSVGAAGVERATRLDETAAGLRVPVRLTRGEAGGDAAQIRFEQEQAKGALGAPIRERSAETNRALGQNLESLSEDVGAETGSHLEAGRSVAETLSRAEAQARATERAAWRRADESGALSDLVDLQPVADYLNQNRAGRSAAPIMGVIADELGVQGIGTGSLADGTLTIGPVNLKQAEGLRKAVNRFVKDNDTADQRVGSDIKRAIDAQTEGMGNELYQQARKSTQRREQLFGQNAVVSQLIRNRKGTADRQVALEDVYRKTILDGSRDDLSMLRRTLDVTDQHAGFIPGKDGPGAQAWRELQGSTLRHLLDEAQKGFAVAQDGSQRFSGAQYSKALRDLDRGDKLRFIFGPQRAQMLRDIGEVARAVQAFPAGAVNSSNTASVVLQAIGEAGLTGSLTGLPVPAVSLIRAGAKAIKDAKTRKRIDEALADVPQSSSPP